MKKITTILLSLFISFIAYAQNDLLAKNYLEQGEYEKYLVSITRKNSTVREKSG